MNSETATIASAALQTRSEARLVRRGDASAETPPGSAKDREVVHGEDGRELAFDRAAERRAVEDVEARARAAQPDRIPGGVTDDARDPSRAAEREQLELEVGAIAQRAQEPAHVARGARPASGRAASVDPDSHVARLEPARDRTQRRAWLLVERAARARSSASHQR